jgi:hypothetical protein
VAHALWRAVPPLMPTLGLDIGVETNLDAVRTDARVTSIERRKSGLEDLILNLPVL